MTKEYKDRFSEAEKELEDKNAFVCLSCDKKYPRKEAEKHERTCCGRTMKELVSESFGA